MHKPTNIFLTCTNNVGMQWTRETPSGQHLPVFTVWRDGKGKVCYTQAVPLAYHAESDARAYFVSNEGRYKRN